MQTILSPPTWLWKTKTPGILWHQPPGACRRKQPGNTGGTVLQMLRSENAVQLYHYSQLGDYYCSKCGFKRPIPDYDGENISLSNGIAFDVKDFHIKTNYRGFYNVYNILAVYAAASVAGIPLDNFNKILGDYTPQFGRNELFQIRGTKVMLNLAKNPAGFNQNISAVMTDQTPKDISSH